jgi:hypothetical protein
MNLQAIPPRPSTPLSWLRLIHDRNPFYLLSAAMMFVGYRVVIAALDSQPGDWWSLLRLIVTMQAYEAAMIAIALYLIVRRGLRRDGWILLGIESLFLVDLTNLNAELYTAFPRLGSVVSAICFALALVKIGVVIRALGLRLTPSATLYGAAQLALLFVLPGLFRLMRTNAATVSPLHIYAVWWLVAGLMTVGATVVRRDPRTSGNPMAALPGRLYVLVPLLSLVVHLASENRVYWVHFQPANVAPLLLAAVVAIHRGRCQPWQLPLSMCLIAGAVLLSIVPDEYRAETTTHLLGLTVTPFRITVLAGGLGMAGLAVWHVSWVAAATLVLCVTIASLGSSWSEIVDRLTRAGLWFLHTLERLVPETALEWGYAAIAGSFVLLGVGAVVSLNARGAPPTLNEPA